MKEHSVDVVVAGAGPAGAHAAACMAHAGLEVALIDRKPKGGAGAQWLNGVPIWMLDEAGVSRPASLGERTMGPIFSMTTPTASRRVRVTRNPVSDLDMRELGQQLADTFESAPSASSYWEHDIIDVNFPNDRFSSLVVRDRTSNQLLRIQAKLCIDASGMNAVIRRSSPWLHAKCRTPAPENICVAAQSVFEIGDLKEARGFLGHHRIESGEILGWVGFEGGFSLLRPEVDLNHGRVSVLTGSIARREFRTGKRILDDFIAEHPWIGRQIFGGHRAIPLRRPYAHLVSPGLALLGDAASQVYSTHGSGIGIGLIAARLLANVVGTAYAGGHDIGAIESLWDYPKKFHRKYGGLLASSDAFRRFSQTLSVPETATLFDRGILTVGMATDALAQKSPGVHPRETAGQLKGLVKALPLASQLLKVLGRMPAMYALAARYPGSPAQSKVTVGAWEYAMTQLVDSSEIR